MIKKLLLFSIILLFSLCTQAQTFNYTKKLTLPNTDSARVADDRFGVTTAMDGNYAIVGANLQDWDSAGGNHKSAAGAAYIFERNNGVWGYVKKLTPPNTDSSRVAGDNFGVSVAISGNYAVVGANAQDYDSVGGNNLASAGAIYVFERNNGVWGYVKKLTPPTTGNARAGADNFGYSVAISGNYIIAGAYGHDWDSAGGNFKGFAGAAYIFERNNGVWGYVKKLTPPNTDSARVANDYFGVSVGIDSNYAVVGAGTGSFGNGNDWDSAGGNYKNAAGAAYVFERNNGTWGYVKKITPPNIDSARVNSDLFGEKAVISGNYLVVTSRGQDYDSAGGNVLTTAGAAYVFERNNGTWGYIKKLTPPNTNNARLFSDGLGFSADIDGNCIVIGATGQDYDSAGGDFVNAAGAAYIFERSNGVWGYSHKIVPTNANNARMISDNLGTAVAISGNFVFATANVQDWDSAGGNFKSGAGAAYVFERPQVCNLTYNNGWSGSSPSGSTGTCNCIVSAGTATIASGASLATLTVNSGATASLSGSLDISGTYTNNGTVSGAGKIVLNGSSAQEIYGTGTTGNLELNNSNGATIQDSLGINGILTLTSGTLITNNKLKLEATGATTYGQIAGTGSGSLSGALTAEMLISGGGTGWRPVSSPVSGATLGSISDDVSLNFGTPGNAYATVYYFNEQVSPYWTIPADTSAAFGDSAFSIYMGGSSSWGNPLPLTLDIPGTYRGTGNYTYNDLTRTGSTADTLGWNYVANPWPSGFLWDDANITVNSGGIQGNQIWLYNQSAGAYQAFDGTDNGVVPPFSPLLFEVTSNNTSITLKNSARTTDSLVNYFDKTGLMNYVEINVADKNGKTDKVKFYTDGAANNGYDIMDGNKKINPAAPNMYFVLEGKKANKEVWNTIPNANEPVFVNMEAWENGDYTLAFAVENLEAGVTVELEDKLAGKRHDLSTGNYAFSYSTTDIKNRFQLHFTRKSDVSAEEITNDAFIGTDGNVLSLSTTNAGVYTVEVFDLLGRTIQAPATVETGAGEPQTLAMSGISPGYYLVKVSGADIDKTYKVYLK